MELDKVVSSAVVDLERASIQDMQDQTQHRKSFSPCSAQTVTHNRPNVIPFGYLYKGETLMSMATVHSAHTEHKFQALASHRHFMTGPARLDAAVELVN